MKNDHANWMQKPNAVILMMLWLMVGEAFGVGIAVTKAQSFHSDASATPFVFLEMIDSGAPFIKFTTSSGNVTIDRVKIAGTIDVPTSIPAKITNEEEIAGLRETCKKLEDFSTRYVKSKPLLGDHIQTIKANIQKFDSGEFRFGGKWMTKEDFYALQGKITKQEAAEKAAYAKLEADELLARQQLEAEALRAKQEMLAFEESQRAKGLEKYNNQWIPMAEAQQRAAEDQRAAAEAERIAAENAAQRQAIETQQRTAEAQRKTAEAQQRIAELTEQRLAMGDRQRTAEVQRLADEQAATGVHMPGISTSRGHNDPEIDQYFQQAKQGFVGVDPQSQRMARSRNPMMAAEGQRQIAQQEQQNKVRVDLAAGRITTEQANLEMARIEEQANLEKVRIQNQNAQQQLINKQQQMLEQQKRANEEIRRIRTEIETR